MENMIEKEFEVKTIRVRAICRCGGEFITTGLAWFSNPIEYEHKCNTCDMKLRFMKSYPCIEYREVE